jgi:hypothetical protein
MRGEGDIHAALTPAAALFPLIVQPLNVLRQCGYGGPICWWLGCGYYVWSCAPLGHI